MSGGTWIALLRGINLGPQRRVAMADLRALLESLGYDDVRTHLQSGNAIFTTSGAARKIEEQISAGIASELGLDVEVQVRSARQLDAVVDANPFVRRKVDPKQLHVAFLSAKPPAKKVAGVDGEKYRPDEFEVGDRAIYMRRPNGIQGSKLPNWERLLGVGVTERNWNTVTRLQALTATRGRPRGSP